MNNFNYTNQNENSINRNNSITKAYTYENNKCFSIDTLKRMEQYTQTINDLNFDIFKIILKKNKILVPLNKNLEKGTFVDNIYGYNIYRKNQNYEEKNSNGFSDILLYKCRAHKYDRFLKSSLKVNFYAIIANIGNTESSNCELVKYIGLNLEVKVWIITSKYIKKGELLKLRL